MKKLIGIFVGVLLLGAPAGAVEWIKKCAESSEGVLSTDAGDVVDVIRPGDYACAEVDAATEETEIIDIQACETIVVYQMQDPELDGNASDLDGTPEICTLKSYSGATEEGRGCVAYPGLTVPLANSDIEVDLRGSFFMMDVGAGAGTEPMRWKIFCEAQ